MRRRLRAYQRQCAFVLVSRPDQLDSARVTWTGARPAAPRHRPQCPSTPRGATATWLAERYGIPPERLAILAAGRLNRGKNILLLAEAMDVAAAAGASTRI